MSLVRKPQINVHLRTKTNRHGKHYQVRMARYTGYLKVDRKTQAWAYCEVRKALCPDGNVKDTAATLLTSANWAEYMDGMRPEIIMNITPGWASKISLRERARH